MLMVSIDISEVRFRVTGQRCDEYGRCCCSPFHHLRGTPAGGISVLPLPG
jgi:hypothetical protein